MDQVCWEIAGKKKNSLDLTGIDPSTIVFAFLINLVLFFLLIFPYIPGQSISISHQPISSVHSVVLTVADSPSQPPQAARTSTIAVLQGKFSGYVGAPGASPLRILKLRLLPPLLVARSCRFGLSFDLELVKSCCSDLFVSFGSRTTLLLSSRTSDVSLLSCVFVLMHVGFGAVSHKFY